MALIEKLLGLETPNIKPNHIFQAALAEWARGRITGTQAIDIVAANNGFLSSALSTADTNEAQAWVALAPAGTQAAQVANRAIWILQQQDIMALMEVNAAGYNTAAGARAKIGL